MLFCRASEFPKQERERKREGGKGEMNKQQNNFLREHEFSRGASFFIKVRPEQREVGTSFLKQNDLFFGALKLASRLNKLSCFV